jgi:DNA mismatch repair protein MutS2
VDSFTLRKIEFDAVRRILSGFCACSLGKAMALRIGASRTPEIVIRWLRQTSQMVDAVRDVGLPPFGGVTDITPALSRAHPSGGASSEDFAAIASTLEGAGYLRRYLLGLPEPLDELHGMGESIGVFDTEVAAIRAIVDSDGSVRDDASVRLGELRRQMAEVSRRIHDVIYSYLQKPEVTRLLQNPNVTLQGDRYVLPVKAENRGRLPGVVHRMSNTGATVFVEPNESVEMNNHLADLHVDERREIERLLNSLAMRISSREDEITTTLRCIAQVDLLSAKAQYAYQFDMTCPEISEHGPLVLPEARHPLLVDQVWRQEHEGVPPEQRHEVVPIDVRLGSDFDLLVITGSNTGGKTVTLKTVALLVMMAQSGMHIPTQRGAKLPIFRDILIDIGDEQSLEQSLSTFGAHIKRIRYILRKADRASLVLLDELGAGTDPDEGGAIGQAVLDELRHVGCLGMLTTHLSVLKAYAMNHERVDNASVEFDTATLSPTFHLHIGTPGESHAITVASRLGLPRRLTGAARKHLGEQGKQFRRAIRATGAARQSAEVAKQEARQAQLAAEDQAEVYETKLADLHRLQSEFETWLAGIADMKPGQEIYVPSLRKAGRLTRLELHKQLAVVDADNVQVEVPLSELMPSLGQQETRNQIARLRQEILDQARDAEKDRVEAKRIQEEYHRSLQHQRTRARQFDGWLGAIARLKVGDEVPIARKPGRGTVTQVDLPGLRATVQTSEGEMELSLQDLFPQTGPFAPRQTKPKAGRHRAPKSPREPAKRPMPRRSAGDKVARGNREKLLAVEPGQQVFVVPFSKQATLIRTNAEKDLAIVQSGIFEMEIPLADLEVVKPPSGAGRGGKHHKSHAGRTPQRPV